MCVCTGGREDGDIGDRGDGGGGASGEGDVGEGRKKKPRISGLYQPPTHEELRTLKETQNLFHSNLMRLQVHVACSFASVLYTCISCMHACICRNTYIHVCIHWV